jgi:hypothetical protein
MWRFFLLVIPFLSACAYAPPVERKALSSPNPTSYIFSAPYPLVLMVVDQLCAKGRPESSADTPTSRAIARCHRPSEGAAYRRANPTGQSRYPLYTPGYAPNSDKDHVAVETRILDSRSYYVGGKPLEFSGSFFVDFERAGTGNTRVSVTAIELSARNGTTRGLHGAVVPNITVLEPTSIEEYEILLYLGNRVGEAAMPPLRLP